MVIIITMSFDRYLERYAFASTQDLSGVAWDAVHRRLHARGLHTFYLQAENGEKFLCVLGFPGEPEMQGRFLERGGTQAQELLISNHHRYDRIGCYAHGNAETVHDATAPAQLLRALGCAYLAHEWSGYGTTADRAPRFHAQVDRCATLLRFVRDASTGARPPLLVGYSLGCAVLLAAWPLAQTQWPSCVLLLAPFYDAAGVVVRVPLLREILGVLALPGMHNGRAIMNLRAPLLVVHGEADNVIPRSHSNDLIRAYNDVDNGQRPAKLRTYPSATHTNLLLDHAVRQSILTEVRAFLDEAA